MKILDKFLMRAFFGPFAVAFGIALFVLVMQFLWVYIDDIMGKGLGLFDITELIFYLSMTMVPLALPISVLISTVMVMGNLAEKYELSSFKSAGVGLLRVMRPLVYIVGAITAFSVVTSDQIIPWANLKFHSRFYDIRKSKPTLTLAEGVFNDEFRDYTMRIGKKGGDGRSLEDVMIYSNKDETGMVNQTIAQRGDMYTTEDKQYIIMNLKDGTQYQELTDQPGSAKRRYPFVRIKFGSWQKIFDLGQFDRQKTDEGLFKGHQKMLSSVKLMAAIDSIRQSRQLYIRDMRRSFKDYLGVLKDSAKTAQIDTASAVKKQATAADPRLSAQAEQTLAGTPFDSPKPQNRPKKDTVYNFYAAFDKLSVGEKNAIYNTAENGAKNVQGQTQVAERQLAMVHDTAGKFTYELHLKYAYAFVCLVFLFIGAPMGAIIQKGGFGMPILVAIFFFMVFMVSNIYCKNLKDSGAVSAEMGAWLPVLVMMPLAIWLTWRSVNDYRLNFNAARFKAMWAWLQSFFNKKTAKTA